MGADTPLQIIERERVRLPPLPLATGEDRAFKKITRQLLITIENLTVISICSFKPTNNRNRKGAV